MPYWSLGPGADVALVESFIAIVTPDWEILKSVLLMYELKTQHCFQLVVTLSLEGSLLTTSHHILTAGGGGGPISVTLISPGVIFPLCAFKSDV